MLAACTLFVLADQTAIFLVANMILFIGISFISGSQEALSYDSLLEKQKKEHYAHVSANASIISNISLLFSFAFGGFLYSIEPWLPWFGMAVTSGIALILSFTLVEPTIDSDKFSISRYIEKTAAGFNNLLSKSMRSLFIPIIVVSSIGYLSTGIVRQSAARYFGFGGDTLGYLLAVIILLAILILYNFERLMKKFSEFNFISSLLIVFVLAYGLYFQAVKEQV
jgi:MFS family permease